VYGFIAGGCSNSVSGAYSAAIGKGLSAVAACTTYVNNLCIVPAGVTTLSGSYLGGNGSGYLSCYSMNWQTDGRMNLCADGNDGALIQESGYFCGIVIFSPSGYPFKIVVSDAGDLAVAGIGV
jgi:hypothetical protein